MEDCRVAVSTAPRNDDEVLVLRWKITASDYKMKDYQRAHSNAWYDNRPWGSIEIANSEFTNIQTVVVGKGVSYIGTNAFESSKFRVCDFIERNTYKSFVLCAWACMMFC